MSILYIVYMYRYMYIQLPTKAAKGRMTESYITKWYTKDKSYIMYTEYCYKKNPFILDLISVG